MTPQKRQASSSSLSNPKSFFRDLWRYFPIWFVYLMGIGLMHYEIANVPPARYQQAGHDPRWFAAMVVIPMAWVALAHWFRLKKESDGGFLKRYLILIGSLLGVAALIYIGHRDKYLSTDRMVTIYEVSQFVWLSVMVVHAWFFGGKHRVVTFFLVCLLYGLMLENAGIIFGFFGESHYRLYLGYGGFKLPAPIATQLGWAIMFYVCIFIAELIGDQVRFLRKSAIRMALFTSLMATSLDLQIDPMASLSGVWWSWNPNLPPWFLGVPFLNFAAWFVAFLPFCYFYFKMRRNEALTDGERNKELLLRVPWMFPLALLIGYPLIILRQGGFNGPEVEIFKEFLRRFLPY